MILQKNIAEAEALISVFIGFSTSGAVSLAAPIVCSGCLRVDCKSSPEN